MCSKTPVSLLQEVLVQHALPLPQYSFAQLPSVPSPEFVCTVTAGNLRATAKAFSKKEAKHRGAELILKQLGVTDLSLKNNIPAVNTSTQLENSVGRLNELSSRNKLSYPTYTECMGKTFPSIHFTVKCQFGELESYGTGANKKDAKQNAAAEMLSMLKDRDLSNIFSSKCVDVKSNGLVATSEVDALAEKLYKQLAFKLKEKETSKVETNLQASSKLKFGDDELNTVEEIRTALDSSEIEYTIEKFQTKPLILMLQIKDTNQVIMEIGDVYEEVYLNLLKKSLIFYSYKVSAESRKALSETDSE